MTADDVTDVTNPPAPPVLASQHPANVALASKPRLRDRVMDWLTERLIGDEPASADLTLSRLDELDGVGRRTAEVPSWQI